MLPYPTELPAQDGAVTCTPHEPGMSDPHVRHICEILAGKD